MPFRLDTLSPGARAQLAAAVLGSLMLLLAIIAIASGGGRWAVALPKIRSETAIKLKRFEDQIKRRDRVIEEIQSDEPK